MRSAAGLVKQITMKPVYHQNPTMRVLVHQCRANGNGLKWAEGGYRRYATSKRSPPPASRSPKQQRAAPKPLPFQTAKPTSSASSSSGGHEDKKKSASELLRIRWFPLFGAGAAAACVGYFMVSISYYWMTQPPEHWTPGQEPETPTGRPSIQSPREFDQQLDKSEWPLGITNLRRRIGAEMARGHVLEVAVGTGRNFEYYDWSVVTEGMEPAKKEEKSGWFSWLSSEDNVNKGGDEKGQENTKGKDEKSQKAQAPRPPAPKTRPQPRNEHAILSFTGLDISPSMMDLALTRIRQVVPHMADQIPQKPIFSTLATKTTTDSSSSSSSPEGITLCHNRLRLLKSDAQTALPQPPSSPKYDTIIQTFGLCSVRDPVLLLSHMAAALQPDTGRIVLLEHGRSWYELVNGLLDRSARQHFERFGCWWNRDIELVVRAAERSIPGLEVLRLERPGWRTLGTHVLVEMRVRGDVAKAATTAATPDSSASGKSGGEQKSTTGWWSSLLSVNSGNGKPTKDDK